MRKKSWLAAVAMELYRSAAAQGDENAKKKLKR
jgi:hypothetical protein